MATKTKRHVLDTRGILTGTGGAVLTYRANDTVFSQGDRADSVFYVDKGRVRVSVLSDRGKEAVLAILGPGDFFGERLLNGYSYRMVSVATMTECSVVRIERAAVLQALQDEPAFSEMFMSYLLRRNARAEADIIDQLFNSSEKRLARLLLLLADDGNEGRMKPVIPHVSQETLAQMIGTTRSRVSSFMNKFRRLRFVEYNGKLTVDTALLKTVMSDEPARTMKNISNPCKSEQPISS